MVKARLIRFFGFSLLEVNEMSYCQAMNFYKAITHLQSEEMLNQMSVVTSPHMKEKDRKKLNAKLDHLRFRENEAVITMDQFARQLNNGQ